MLAGVPVGRVTPTLTPQEQVIAGLVCAGHSNRQIAAKLVLSPKTVGYHLANVYAKLGVHSRLQLAQALDQQPLPEASAGPSSWAEPGHSPEA